MLQGEYGTLIKLNALATLRQNLFVEVDYSAELAISQGCLLVPGTG